MNSIVLSRVKRNSIFSVREIFESIDSFLDMNWLISDVFPMPIIGIEKTEMRNNYSYLSGKELSEVIDKNPWLFAIFSGFSSTIFETQILEYPLPYADGNPGFWHNPVQVQHPLAELEIVAWDGTLFMCISKDSTIINGIINKFPEAEDLEIYNLRNNG